MGDGYHASQNKMEQAGLNRDEWLEKLMLVDQSLQKQGATAQLTLVGSAAGIFAGQTRPNVH